MNSQGPKKIEYLTHTWNPVIGCLHNCPYCYVPRVKGRFMPNATREEIMKPAFLIHKLRKPLGRAKPSRIGVCFSGDLFGEWVPENWINPVLGIIEQCPQHRFLLLTKNPKRYGEFEIPENCWCGTSTTGIEEEKKRIDILREVVQPWRSFISLEPWIGGIPYSLEVVDWLIVGGKTGKEAAKPPAEDVEKLMYVWRDLTDAPVFIKSNAGFHMKIQEYPAGLLLPHEKTSTRGSHE